MFESMICVLLPTPAGNSDIDISPHQARAICSRYIIANSSGARGPKSNRQLFDQFVGRMQNDGTMCWDGCVLHASCVLCQEVK